MFTLVFEPRQLRDLWREGPLLLFSGCNVVSLNTLRILGALSLELKL